MRMMTILQCFLLLLALELGFVDSLLVDTVVPQLEQQERQEQQEQQEQPEEQHKEFLISNSNPRVSVVNPSRSLASSVRRQVRGSQDDDDRRRRALVSIGDVLNSNGNIQIMAQLISLMVVVEPELRALLQGTSPTTTNDLMTALIPLDSAFLRDLPITLVDHLLSDDKTDPEPVLAATGQQVFLPISPFAQWQMHRRDLVLYHLSTNHQPVPNGHGGGGGGGFLNDSTELVMMNGDTVTVVKQNRQITFDDVAVATMGELDNGSSFTLSAVLPRLWLTQTIWHVVATLAPRFLELAVQADLEDVLRQQQKQVDDASSSSSWTVLVPSEASLSTIVPWAKGPQLRRVLLYHMIPQVVPLESLVESAPPNGGDFIVTNALGYNMTVAVVAPPTPPTTTMSVTVQGQELLPVNQKLATNGIVYFIPQILRSDYDPSQSQLNL